MKTKLKGKYYFWRSEDYRRGLKPGLVVTPEWCLYGTPADPKDRRVLVLGILSTMANDYPVPVPSGQRWQWEYSCR